MPQNKHLYGSQSKFLTKIQLCSCHNPRENPWQKFWVDQNVHMLNQAVLLRYCASAVINFTSSKMWTFSFASQAAIWCSFWGNSCEKCLPAPLYVSQVMAPVWQCAGCALVSGLQNVQTCSYFDVKVEQLATEASLACVCDPAVMCSIKSMRDTLYYNVKNQWAALDNRGIEELPKRMTERDSRLLQPVWR